MSENPADRITLERKVETLVDQLAGFDERIHRIESKVEEIIDWMNKLFKQVNPIVIEYTKNKALYGNGTGNPPPRQEKP